MYFVASRPTPDTPQIGTPCVTSLPPSGLPTGSVPTTVVLTGTFTVPTWAVLGVPYKVYLAVCPNGCTTPRVSHTDPRNRLFASPFTVLRPSIQATAGPIRASTRIVITGYGFTPPLVAGAAQGCVLTGQRESGTCTVAPDGTLSGSLSAAAATAVMKYSVTATNTVSLPPGVVVQAPVQVASTTVEVVPAPPTSTTKPPTSTPTPTPGTSVASAAASDSQGRPASTVASTPGGHDGNDLFAWPLSGGWTTGLGLGLLVLATALLFARLRWRQARARPFPDVRVRGGGGALPIPGRLGSRQPPMITLDLRLRHRRTTWFDPRREA